MAMLSVGELRKWLDGLPDEQIIAAKSLHDSTIDRGWVNPIREKIILVDDIVLKVGRIDWMPHRMKLVVTGCGRSGTAYSAALWRALGKDVGHKQWGADGISAFQVAHPFHRKNYEWDKHINGTPPRVFHIVRHPLKVISSWMGRPDTLVGMLDGAEQWEPLERCALYWLEWNQLVEREFPLACRYRIETVQDRIREWALLAGIEPTEAQMTKAKAVPTNYSTAHASIKTHGSHKYEHIYTWTELIELIPHELVRQIEDQAVRYGYLT